MPENFEKKTLKDFFKLLGSQAGAPGGGAAAALTVVAGIAIAEMVTRINLRRTKTSARNLKKLVQMRQRSFALIGLDAKAFSRIAWLYKKSKRGAALQKALKNGAKYPEEMCFLASRAAALAALQKKTTSRWLISDLKEAAILLRAGFDSAQLNVDVNTRSFKNRRDAASVRRRLSVYNRKLEQSRRYILRGGR